MQNVLDLVPLQPVILAARQLPYAAEAQVLADAFPDTPVRAIKYRFGRPNQLAQSVPVRPFGGVAPIIARPGLQITDGALPAISALLPLSEEGILREQLLAYTLDNPGAGLPEDLLLPTVEGDSAQTTQAVKNTYSRLQGLALSTGTIVLNENGVTQTVDFGVPGGNKVTAGTLWTNTAADIVTMLRTWLTAYIGSAGGPPGVVYASQRVISLMGANLSVIAAVAGSTLGRTFAFPTELTGLLAALGLPPIQPIDAILKDSTGTVSRLFPDNVFVLAPSPGQLGETQLGITAEATVLAGAGILRAADMPGLVVVTMTDDEPVGRFVKTASIGLPVVDFPEGLFIATVA